MWEMTPCLNLNVCCDYVRNFFLPSSKLHGVTFLRTVFLILALRASNSIESIFYYGEGSGNDVPVHGMKARIGVGKGM